MLSFSPLAVLAIIAQFLFTDVEAAALPKRQFPVPSSISFPSFTGFGDDADSIFGGLFGSLSLPSFPSATNGALGGLTFGAIPTQPSESSPTGLDFSPSSTTVPGGLDPSIANSLPGLTSSGSGSPFSLGDFSSILGQDSAFSGIPSFPSGLFAGSPTSSPSDSPSSSPSSDAVSSIQSDPSSVPSISNPFSDLTSSGSGSSFSLGDFSSISAENSAFSGVLSFPSGVPSFTSGVPSFPSGVPSFPSGLFAGSPTISPSDSSSPSPSPSPSSSDAVSPIQSDTSSVPSDTPEALPSNPSV